MLLRVLLAASLCASALGYDDYGDDDDVYGDNDRCILNGIDGLGIDEYDRKSDVRWLPGRGGKTIRSQDCTTAFSLTKASVFSASLPWVSIPPPFNVALSQDTHALCRALSKNVTRDPGDQNGEYFQQQERHQLQVQLGRRQSGCDGFRFAERRTSLDLQI